MGPYQRTPKEVDRAVRYSGLGVRSWISWVPALFFVGMPPFEGDAFAIPSGGETSGSDSRVTGRGCWRPSQQLFWAKLLIIFNRLRTSFDSVGFCFFDVFVRST